MEANGRSTLIDVYPAVCQICKQTIRGAQYDSNGELVAPFDPAKVIGLRMGDDGIPVSLYAHLKCLNITAASVSALTKAYMPRDDYTTCVYCAKPSAHRFCSDRCAKLYEKEREDAVSQSISPSVVALVESLKQIRGAVKPAAPPKDGERIFGQHHQAKPATVMVEDAKIQIRNAQLAGLASDVGVFVPQNEMGVVFMLGSVLSRIGYRMAHIDGRYPDAVLVGPNKQAVKTEFEFQSSSFITHGHDPRLCDLVICWRHDAKLRLPVIELSRYYDTKTGIWDFHNLRYTPF